MSNLRNNETLKSKYIPLRLLDTAIEPIIVADELSHYSEKESNFSI